MQCYDFREHRITLSRVDFLPPVGDTTEHKYLLTGVKTCMRTEVTEEDTRGLGPPAYLSVTVGFPLFSSHGGAEG